MKSSQKKKSAAWNTTTTTKTRVDEMGSYIPPLWSNVYKLSTVKEENTKEGYKWHGWAIQFVKWLDEGKDDAILQVYKSFFETVSNSDIFGKVDFESGIEETETKPQEKPKPVQVENQSGDTPF